ncbi:MAG: radical SAM protein [Kiritimatiellia bacterium]
MSDLLLFVQLPQLDTLVSGAHENLYLAAAYLEWAVRRSPIGPSTKIARLPPEMDSASDCTLLAAIVGLRPRFIACTVYLWNIERTLALMHQVKRALPGSAILVGGPDVARTHPLLYSHSPADVVTIGEGEWVLPAILAALKAGKQALFSYTAWKSGGRFRWGVPEAPETALRHDLPPPDWTGLAPDARGMAYVETSRGCPMHCTYCRYHHLRRHVSLLDPEAIVERVDMLRKMGAREIRFVDPTFNSHSRFTETLRLLADLNRDRKLAFFAELRADRLTAEQADLLAAARFTDIESGVQSLDPKVLKAIGRPTNTARTGEGIRLMARRGIRVTLDLMIGLPYQTRAAAEEALDWALTFPRSVNIQCMHTLLLPGTDLRRQAARWKIRFDPLPPYAVQETPWMSRNDFLAIEARLAASPRLSSDNPTPSFIGHALPDLFPHPQVIPVPWQDRRLLPPGPRFARQAWIFRGTGLFEHTDELEALVHDAIAQSPHTLWQFVLEPATEEPLDLLEALIAAIRRHPPMIIDRYAPVAFRNLLSSRRILIRLRRGRSYDAEWIAAARECLESAFF